MTPNGHQVSYIQPNLSVLAELNVSGRQSIGGRSKSVQERFCMALTVPFTAHQRGEWKHNEFRNLAGVLNALIYISTV